MSILTNFINIFKTSKTPTDINSVQTTNNTTVATPPTRKVIAIILRDQGKTPREIADELEVSLSSVYGYLKESK